MEPVQLDSLVEIVSNDRPRLTAFERSYFNLVQRLSVAAFEKRCNGEVFGLENIPNQERGIILAINHSSYLDWLVLFSFFKKYLNKEITFLAKEKLYRSIIWRKLIKAANCIEVAESGLSASSMRRVCRVLKNGGIIGIFPEGTRSHSGELLKAKEGVAQIAYLSNAPVVPIGLAGFYETWPRHRLLPRFKKCSVHIGQPIRPDHVGLMKSNFDEFTTLVMREIGALINKNYVHA